MKKLLSILLTMVLAMSLLAACGSDEKGTDADETPATEATEDDADAADEVEDAEADGEEAEDADAEDDADADEADAADGDAYQIGVVQFIEHAALDASNQGFVDALEEAGINVEIEQQNAQGEQATCETIATKFEADGKDLVYAIATPAAQAMAGKTSEIPIIFSAVTDAVEGELVDDNDAPGGNITGASDLTPVAEQIDLLQQILPDAETVGILYCSAEANSVFQADMAKEAIDAAGLSWQEFTVSSSNEIQSVVESMIGKVDVLYAPTDNMIAAGMATVAMVANENGLPSIVGEDGMVEEGGLATYGIDYYELGKLAAQQAIEILTNGADPAEMPVAYLSADECAFSYNAETAEELGIEIPAELLD